MAWFFTPLFIFIFLPVGEPLRESRCLRAIVSLRTSMEQPVAARRSVIRPPNVEDSHEKRARSWRAYQHPQRRHNRKRKFKLDRVPTALI
jgi:hypothetical protein